MLGQEGKLLLDHLALPPDSKATLLREALEIVSECLPSTAKSGSVTGLVIGYVQSGKTVSFTTVSALVRDNGYGLVLLIAGTSDPLLLQSTNRIIQDLRLQTRQDFKWQHFQTKSLNPGAQATIQSALDEWKDKNVPASQQSTVLLTVMKNYAHLKRVVSLLRHLDLRGIPALVIDDEADQASLNTKVKKGERSSTYEALLDLRAVLPSHTFLQYTATPQAPLLINIIDNLSPKFAEVLTPGRGYAGGKEFFHPKTKLVQVIPDSEIGTKAQPLTGPPKSLKMALRLFFLGVAAEYCGNDLRGRRSMLVHPSQETSGHQDYFDWVLSISDLWKRVLDPASKLAAERSSLLSEFRESYKNLKDTVGDLPTCAKLEKQLLRAIRRTPVTLINAVSGTTPEVDWSQSYSHILVGGQAMDRGFTVEGLTVTYMPRSLGVGHIDTVQQRARFFGYKRSYLGYCRVFIPNRVRDAYQGYVTHEEQMRKSLSRHRQSGRPLSEWKRLFFLDRALKPTRQTVLELDYMRGTLGTDWFVPGPPYESVGATGANREVVKAFLARIKLTKDPGSTRRSSIQTHGFNPSVPLKFVFETLLTELKVLHLEDSQRFTALQIVLENQLAADSRAQCAVFQMSRGELRKRSLKDGEIENLFQGANPPTGDVGSIYPGDRNIGPRDRVCIQLHRLNLEGPKGARYADIPAMAIRLPKKMEQHVVFRT